MDSQTRRLEIRDLSASGESTREIAGGIGTVPLPERNLLSRIELQAIGTWPQPEEPVTLRTFRG